MKTSTQKKVQIIQKESTKTNKKENEYSSKISSSQNKLMSSDMSTQFPPNIENEKYETQNPTETGEGNLTIHKKKQIINKPRENYLNNKKNEMNLSQSLNKSIQSGLDSQVTDIKSQIQDKSILITEPKDLNKYINRSASTQNKVIKYSNEDYQQKQLHKVVTDLKEEQNTLRMRLKKIEENEALLNKEGFMNLNNSYQGPTKYEKSMREYQMKNAKNKKNEINDRLTEIEFRINHILEEESMKVKKRDNLQKFKENFERDKEIIEARAQKYLRESKERNQRFENEIKQLEERRQKEIEEKEKNDQLKKEKLIKKFIEKEREEEKKRLNKNEAIMLKYKPYINQTYKKTDDLYTRMEKKYQEREKKLLDKLNRDKKIRSKTVTNDELQEFWEEIEKKKEILKEKKEKRDQKENELFEMAKNYKPSYVSCYSEMIDEENMKFLEKERIKKDEILQRVEKRKEIGEDIRKKKHYEIDEKLQRERMDRIAAIENPKLFQIKETLKKQKKNRILLKKRDTTKPSKYKWELKLKDESLNNSDIIKDHLLKKPKVIKFAYSYADLDEAKENKDNKDNKNNKDNIRKGEKKIEFPNYLKILAEQRKRKEKHRREREEEKKEKDENIEEEDKNQKESNEDQLNDIGNLVQKIYLEKQKAENLGQIAEREQQLLRINGGIKNNPELGKKVTGHLIDSIKTKLNILNQFNEN